MIIRQATAQEMLNLWGCGETEALPPTAQFFFDNLTSGNAEFWAVEDGGALVGELYVFRKLPDPDFANGAQRAYLCAFRMKEGYQGQGLGSRLLETVLGRLQDEGIALGTIGVETTNEAALRLYRRFGFDTKIKDCHVDPCWLDDAGVPRACPCFHLLSKQLR